MSWAESVLLAQVLLRDPSSYLAAAVEGWEYPATLEVLTAADTFDALVALLSDKKNKPYPRPFDRKKKTFGKKPRPSQDDIRAALRARGHDI